MKLITVLSIVSALGMVAACGSDDDDGGGTGGKAGAGGGTAGSGGGTSGSGGGTAATGGTSGSGGGTAGTGGGTAGTGGGTGDGDGVDGLAAEGVPGANWIYGFSDDVASTHNVTAGDTAGEYCLDGTGGQVVDMNYAGIYGAGMGVQYATADEMGVITAPFDATGLATISLNLTTNTGVRIALMDSMDRAYYIVEGAMPTPVMYSTSGPVEIDVSMLGVANWDAHTIADLDLSMIKAVQISVPTNETAAVPYDFCVSDVALLDGDGMQIGGGGGAGGAGGAGG